MLSLILAGKMLEASPIKISFLDNEEAIEQTTKFLLSNGCDLEAVSSFQRVVDWYNATPTDLNLKKFPPRVDGFYSFQSISNLIEDLPHPLIYTLHQSELNCFDTLILLAGNLIQTTLKPDDISGPFLPPLTTTNNDVVLRVAATPKDAFTIVCPAWWLEASKSIFSVSIQDKRICLMAAFDFFHFLPSCTTREDLASKLLKTLQVSWKSQGIVFPTNLAVVFFHSVALNEHNSTTSHAGLLFRNNDRFVYIEKAGSSGPYVRLDFTEKKDLFIWYKAAIKPTADQGNLSFATFNDKTIENLDEIAR